MIDTHDLARKFLEALGHTWNALEDKSLLRGDPFLEHAKTPWTKAMLDIENGPFKTIAACLSSEFSELGSVYCRGQDYTVDMVLWAGNPNVAEVKGNDPWYPERSVVLIEHEFEGDIETELWKLMHRRGLLKVIFCHDFNERHKISNKSDHDWLANKREKLRKLFASVQAFQGQEPHATYLLIVGNREHEGAPVVWRWAPINDTDPCELVQLVPHQCNAK